MMGKNAGGVSDWHKKQHKKQLAKNKEARIAARDERVVQEKTVQEVRAEIRKLEQQYKNEEQRPHPIQSKLDRLKKELKLVAAKEDADKQNRERTLQQQKAIPKAESYVPLERPEVSVYFDAVMNPFGAPPPGQPKLYYRRGGGTTMNLNEACTPQEQFLPPPPPPPPPPPQMNAPTSQRPPPTRRPSSQNARQSRGIPGKDNRKLVVESKTNDAIPATSPSKPEKVPVHPSQLPSLPAPSTAVSRMKQNRLAVDIWASQEEIAYEAQVSATSLEGIVTVTTAPSVWFYQDISGAVQGPFTTEQICQWNQAGYFPNTTPVSGTSHSGPWKPLSEIKVLNDSGSKKGPPDSCNATKPTSSIQDRIAALRQSNASSSVGISPEVVSALDVHQEDDPEPQGEDTVQSRIAALKAQHLPQEVVAEEEHDQDQGDEAGHGPLHVLMTPGQVDDAQDKGVYSDALDGSFDSDGPKGMTVKDRIAALRAQHSNAVTEDEVGELRFGRKYDEENKNLPLPPPPPPPKYATALEDIPLYPVDDVVAAYPIDDEMDMNYSEPHALDDQHVSYSVDDQEYPVTGDYGDGNDEYPIDPSESYPVTDPYVDDGKEVVQPSKKKVKLDQAVRSLVPSRLLKR
jgi:GYF domain/mRNA biogenesis factor/WW domain binding protein 11